MIFDFGVFVWFALAAALLAAAGLFWRGFQRIEEKESGVVLTMGRHAATRGPGWTFLFPVIQRMVRVSLAPRTMVLSMAGLKTKDREKVAVRALLEWRVNDPAKAALKVFDHGDATRQFAELALAEAVWSLDAAFVLRDHGRLEAKFMKILSAESASWGVEVLGVQAIASGGRAPIRPVEPRWPGF